MNTLHLIDWDAVVDQCKDNPGNTLRYNKESFSDTTVFGTLDATWQAAGYQYNDSTIEWTNYFPGKDFDNEVVNIFSGIVNAKPWMVWISKIRPGKMAPWHYDAHTKLNELLKLGTPVRYTCYIQDPHPGHVSIVGDQSVYLPAKGSIFKWSSYDAWHCGMNGGLADKYMFNFWGYQ